jgi:hypothetical protein
MRDEIAVKPISWANYSLNPMPWSLSSAIQPCIDQIAPQTRSQPELLTMQFGRLIGAVLAGLGILLLFLQLSFFMDSWRAPAPLPVEPHRHHINALPGILGGVLLLGGVVVFFTGQIEDEADRKHAIK